jgi:hypothetical protein
MRIEHRRCERFSPKKDVTVALIYPPQESEYNLTGSLIDIGQFGLAFKYLPFGTLKTSTRELCEVSLLGIHTPTKLIRCRKVYEVDSRDESGPLPSEKRVGLEFLIPLSPSELQTVISK